MQQIEARPCINGHDIVGEWLQANTAGIDRVQSVLQGMRTAGKYDFATLSVAIQEIRKLGMVSGKGKQRGA